MPLQSREHVLNTDSTFTDGQGDDFSPSTRSTNKSLPNIIRVLGKQLEDHPLPPVSSAAQYSALGSVT